MADPLPLRLFVASPGDLADGRGVVRSCVAEHNARSGRSSNVRFEVVGWEQIRGTARRPQDAINELISESHFLVAMFRASWGSEPGSTWGYTSGTEEELFTALLELGQPEQPMRDVWVAFLDDSSPDRRISLLRVQMSTRHPLMYESVADIRDLKSKFAKRLESWAEASESKIPQQVDLLPSSGKDVLRAANLRLRGEKLVELGQVEAGRKALEEASVLGGPLEHLAHGRFLARHGDLGGAYAATQKAIDFFAAGTSQLYSPLAAESFAAQAGMLRRQGKVLEAVGRLEQALTLLPDTRDPFSQKTRCRILDDLGLALQQLDDLASARRAFEEALGIRRASHRNLEVCQSLINLARLEVRANNFGAATDHVHEVQEHLQGVPPSALRANAEVLAAQLLLRAGKPAEGIAHAERALAINKQIGSRNGEAISLLLLAQCRRADGSPREAAEDAQACLALNESMGNHAGMKRAQWILDQLAG